LQSNATAIPRSDLGNALTGGRPRSQRPARRRQDLIAAVVAERKRLSRELHDAVGQSLNSVLMQIRLASVRGTAGVADLRLLETTTQQALDQARALAYRLRVIVPDSFGEARLLAEHLLDEQECLLEWLDDRTSRDLAPRVVREVSAAIKESVANIARHASAGRAKVRLESPGRSLRVTIEDDGVGFEPEQVELSPDGRGLGLLGMAERLEGIGGSLTVISRPGMGTTVVLEADRGIGQPPGWPVRQTVTAGAGR
jgi:signal transduction histidine kinase